MVGRNHHRPSQKYWYVIQLCSNKVEVQMVLLPLFFLFLKSIQQVTSIDII